MRLNELSDNPGSRKGRMRICRGIGSGKGKTGGRGVKGQKARSGVAIKGFEGGQMPLHMRIPKRGFNQPGRAKYAEINLDTLVKAIEAGAIDASKLISESVLVEAGVIRRKLDGIRLLGRGTVDRALTLELSGATGPALAAVEKAGGTVTISARAPAPDKSDT